MYFASAATIQRGQRGKNKALHYTDKERRGGQGEVLLAAVLFFFFLLKKKKNHENSELDYVKPIAVGDVKSPTCSYVTCQAEGKYQYHNAV